MLQSNSPNSAIDLPFQETQSGFIRRKHTACMPPHQKAEPPLTSELSELIVLLERHLLLILTTFHLLFPRMAVDCSTSACLAYLGLSGRKRPSQTTEHKKPWGICIKRDFHRIEAVLTTSTHSIQLSEHCHMYTQPTILTSRMRSILSVGRCSSEDAPGVCGYNQVPISTYFWECESVWPKLEYLQNHGVQVSTGENLVDIVLIFGNESEVQALLN
ncbi:hypothetical protein T265_03664 [Opisthorchis viverrini]|uniref:Uncharacterized protein n=1 Tax=Opisthorchis viverrini TaxID=6198 RepID=A0A074ZV82_OPIVI|nr:hypothetical protein T265_03664 [Opisthorchis viverrini]KER29752.1 hypothetical protein T265_03664 [Opisthorchis viverrini]